MSKLVFSLSLFTAGFLVAGCSPLAPSVSKFSGNQKLSPSLSSNNTLGDTLDLQPDLSFDGNSLLVTPNVLSVNDYNSAVVTENLSAYEVMLFSSFEEIKITTTALSSADVKVYAGVSHLNQLQLANIQNIVKISISIVEESGKKKFKIGLAKLKPSGNSEEDLQTDTARTQFLDNINNLGIHFID